MSNVEMRPLLEVLQGYRDHFRQGGMDVHPVDDGHHGSSRCHGINDFLNKDWRIGTDNMESQKATAFFLDYDLGKTIIFFYILLQIADRKDSLSFGEGKEVCSDRKKTCNVEKREQAPFFVETASQTVREWRGKSKLSEAIFVDFRHELTYTI